MGYSGRYHAASLAAVFVALAVGILIGIGLADDVVSGASQELEDSLRSDLDAARKRSADLEAALERERQFSSRALPALVDGRLAGQSVALIGLGGVPDEVAGDTRAALRASGAELTSVADVRLPPDAKALTAELRPRYADAREDPDAMRELGAAIGRRMAGGGGLLERRKEDLFDSFNGSLADVSRVVMIRQPPEDLDKDEQELSDAFEQGLMSGVDESGAYVAGVERVETDPTTLAPFAEQGIATVDDVDLPAGKVALVAALLGAEGQFGVKEDATTYMPDLLGDASLSTGPRR